MELSEQQMLRYARHILLDSIDLAGQNTLLDSHVVVIGCGGLGAVCVPFLGASGVGKITLIDGDYVELSNLQRQVSYRTCDVGMHKASVLSKYVNHLNPEIDVSAINEHIDECSLFNLVQDHKPDILIDCTDNFATRHLINRVSHKLSIPLVSGSAVSTSGQLAVYCNKDKKNPCYACVFPEKQIKVDELCVTLGVLSPLVGIIGSYQANLCLQVLLNWPLVPWGILIHFDALAHSWFRFSVSKNRDCPVCGDE